MKLLPPMMNLGPVSGTPMLKCIAFLSSSILRNLNSVAWEINRSKRTLQFLVEKSFVHTVLNPHSTIIMFI